MVRDVLPSLFDLYEVDETAWLEATAILIREGRLDELDYPHLQEFLDDMAHRDRREVSRRLAILIAHLLKWRYQPEKRTGSWRATIEVQRRDLTELLESTTLRQHAEESLLKIYANGVLRAVADTNLPATTFPETCVFTIDEILTEELD